MDIVWFVGGFFILSTLLSLVCLRGEKPPFQVCYVLSVVLTLVGVVDFCASWLGPSGGLGFLPASFEWPVGVSEEALVDSQGRFVVHLAHCGRIQLYGADRRFIRGWFVRDYGADEVKIHMTDREQVEVFTARGNHRYLFDLNGTIVEEGNYRGVEYGAMPSGPYHRFDHDIRWYEYPFAHASIAGVSMVMGIAGLGLLQTRHKRRLAAARREKEPDPKS